ncbi:MAG: maleylpyruvate isomerase family mycothiol-dependent enzyme [Anaerolineae bacterium]
MSALLDLLSELSSDDWDTPTACPLWSVKDVALHLLGDDVVMLSSRRDRQPSQFSGQSWDQLVAFINAWNETWVQATRRISPRLLVDLLKLTGTQVNAYFESRDPYAVGAPVSWAGPDPAPVWLDLAREYTERWHHQQHIREAVARAGLKGPRFLSPVLDTFVRAVPHTFRDTQAVDGTLVALTISGPAGSQWFLRREGENWRLYVNGLRKPHAEVTMDQDVAWRLFTRGLSKDEVRGKVTLVGDTSLGERILDTVSIIA